MEKKQGMKKSHPLVGRKFGTSDWDKKGAFSIIGRCFEWDLSKYLVRWEKIFLAG